MCWAVSVVCRMLDVTSRLVPSRLSSDTDGPDGAPSEPSSSNCLVFPISLEPAFPTPLYLERLERARTGKVLEGSHGPCAVPEPCADQLGEEPRAVTRRGVEVVEALVVGVLTKKASRFPFNWRERYCAIDAATRTLSYYKSELEAQGHSKPKGQTAAVLAASALPNEPRGIRFEDAAGRVLFALARNEADRERWLESLRRAFEPAPREHHSMMATGGCSSPTRCTTGAQCSRVCARTACTHLPNHPIRRCEASTPGHSKGVSGAATG